MTAPSEDFRLAGQSLRVMWHDPALRAALRPALAHRAETGPPPSLAIDALLVKPALPLTVTDSLHVLESRDGLTVIDPASGLMSEVNLEATRAIYGIPEPGRLPVPERAAPFRLILQTWLRAHGTHLLHAGAVGLPGRGAVLLAATGGGGKSNTFLACLASSSLQLLGEDFVAVDGAAAPRVWSLFSTAKLHAADVARFPALAGEATGSQEGPGGKVLFDLAPRHAPRFAEGLPLRAVLVLKITDSPVTRIVPANPGEAVKAMLTSLLMVLPSARRPLFEFTTGLARRVPAYRLELGRDPAQIAAGIERFLLQ